MTKQLKTDLMLLVLTVLWGISYLVLDYALEHIGPLTVSALRFLIAFIALGAVFFRRMKGVSRTTVLYSAAVGGTLALAYMGASFGMLYTSLSNAAFLCALSVILTPVLNFFIFRVRPGRKLGFVLLMALAGVALMTLNERFTPSLGDLLCLMCALAYAGDLLITERALKKTEVNALQMGVLVLGFAGVFNLIPALVFEMPFASQTPRVWAAVLFLAIFCTGISFIGQTVAQQYTSAARVGVIFSLEPVFAGIAAFFILGEVLPVRGYVGAAIMLLSFLVMELPLKRSQPKEAGDENSDIREEQVL